MREIKFRVWVKDEIHGIEEKMYYCDEMEHHACGILFSGPIPCFDIKDCKVMQYTGLKDSKGKEIYEGDILKYFKHTVVVCFANAHFMVCAGSNPYDTYHEDLWKAKGRSKIEIIGNIYENPELLEKDSNKK